MADDKGPGWTRNLAIAVLTAAMCACQHGYSTAILSNSQDSIKYFIGNVTQRRGVNGTDELKAKKELIVSGITAIYCIGGAIGGMVSGYVVAKLGFKRGLLWNNVPVLVAAILFGFSKMADSWEMLLVGRLIIGFNNGLGSGLAPTYSTELSPKRVRGMVGSCYQLFLTLLIVIAQMLGVDDVLGSDDRWPILFSLIIVPAILQVIGLSFCRESPKHLLISQNNPEAAEQALVWVRGTPDVQAELQVIRDEAEQIKQSAKVTLKEMYTNPVYWQPLKISIVIMLSQQLSGINAAIGYSTKIFEAGGVARSAAPWVSVGMGVLNFLMTFASFKLVDDYGRRVLLLSGMAGMAVVAVFLSLTLSLKDIWTPSSYISIGLVWLFVVFFASGPGSIPWFVVGELFGNAAKDWATSIAVGVNWTAAALVFFAYPHLEAALGPPVFLVFTILLIVFFCYVYKRVPETKNKPIEDVTNLFRK